MRGVLFAIAIVFALAAFALLPLNARVMGTGAVPFYALIGLIVLVYSSVGALLASRVPRNPIGWILEALGAFVALSVFLEQYGLRGLELGIAGRRSAEVEYRRGVAQHLLNGGRSRFGVASSFSRWSGCPMIRFVQSSRSFRSDIGTPMISTSVARGSSAPTSSAKSRPPRSARSSAMRLACIPDLGLQRLDVPRCEVLVQDRAQASVPGRIEVEHVLADEGRKPGPAGHPKGRRRAHHA